LCTGAIAGTGVAFAPAAHADSGDGSSSSTITGYTANVEGLAVQFAFNVPGVLPLPGDNILEADVPFARTSVSNGPVITAQGTPFWPGDILGNFGSLISLFEPSAPPIPNDPLQAEAQYPPSPSHGQSSSFGGTPPAGVPFAPNVFSATAHADASGANVTATLTDLQFAPPSAPSAGVVHLGPSSPSVLGALGAVAGPAIDIGQVQSTNQVAIADSAVTGTATTILKAIDIAGVLNISQITSNASSQSDGNAGTPTASLHMLGVTVEGLPAYIDSQGVHVSGSSTSSIGITPAQAQNTLDATFAQDGINVRLLDPATTSNGAEGDADAGGLVVSLSHKFAVPYIPGEPTIPLPALGNVGLPAGTYEMTTSVTLGAATSDVQAALAPAFSGSGSGSGVSIGLGGDSGLGLELGGLGSDLGIPSGSFGSVPGTSGPATSASGSPSSLGARASNRLPFGIPAPLGWLIVLLLLCVVMAYPMLLAARWQFLSGGR